MRLIDADAKEYCKDCNHVEMCRWYPFSGCEFRELPKDAVAVVRCKECKHRDAKANRHIHCTAFNLWMREDFFCADGRRTE